MGMDAKPNRPVPLNEIRINNTAALGVITAFLGLTVACLAKDPHLAQVSSNAGYAAGLLAYIGTIGKAMFNSPQWESTIRVR